ncbi:MAG TPA: molybdopterin-dependent oxidoreductase, partial [Anaerolineae bacterium]
MRKGSSWWLQAALLGALTGLAVIALSYLAEQALGLPFVPFVLFDWLTRVLPGGVITLGIDAMVRVIVASGTGPIDVVAKAIEQSFGMALWLAVSLAIAIALAAWLRRQSVVVSGTTMINRGAGRQAGAFAGLAFALLVVAAMIGLRSFGANQPWTLLWLAVLLPGWGAVLGALLEQLVLAEGGREAPAEPSRHASGPGPAEAVAAADSGAPPPAPAGRLPVINRRAFLQRAAGGSVLVAILAAGLGRLLALDKVRTGAGQPLGEVNVQAAPPGTPAASAAPGAGAPAAAVFPPTPSGRSAPAPGTRPEITPTADFYRIDIDLVPPEVAGNSWQLKVSGLFDKPRNLTLPDLLAMEAVTQPITQSCISNPIGGDLISSAYYTGVRLRDVLAGLGVQPAARQLALHAADGFYESVAMQDLQDPRVLLVYGMNGTTL